MFITLADFPLYKTSADEKALSADSKQETTIYSFLGLRHPLQGAP